MREPLQYELHTVESVKSTNTSLKEIARQGGPEGYVLIASMQTNGRGRMNRVFYSPQKTGLYCSVLLRPKVSIPPYALTCMSAVAVSETVESFEIPCSIKWVNDIYVENKKAAGILTEGTYAQDGSYQYAIVGIGVNLFAPENGFPKQIEDTATAVFKGAPDEAIRKLFIKRMLQRFKYYYDLLPEMPFRSLYCEKQMIIGRSVLFTDACGMKRGTACGIDEDFRLVVKTSDGKVYAVDRGDVTIL